MINVKNKEDCCGCTACASICPKNCISMEEDNEGFVYPFIDKEKCINCDLCEKVCPIIKKNVREEFNQDAYIVQNKDEKVLSESTAGGAFTSIAKYVLDKGGVVFGVEFTKEQLARHISIENVNELSLFRNSKYIQSFVGDSYKQVRDYLEQGRYVCFSGTPCQIEGLKSYLKKDYPKLITVDVVCRAVPSPLIFKKYIEYQEGRLGDKIKTVRFRDKFYGYKYSTMNIITSKNKRTYHRGVESDPWLRAFFSNICDRPSCHNCRFRGRYRNSDFTIWDCFHVDRFSKELDNDKGATRVLLHTQKAKVIFDEIKGSFSWKKIAPEEIIKGCKEMEESVRPHKNRDSFFLDANQLEGTQLFKKYFPDNFRVKAERTIRLLCYKLGIYSVIKRFVVRISRKY